VANAGTSFSIPSTNFTNYTIAAIVNWAGTNAATQDITGNDTNPGGSGTNLSLTSTGVIQARLNAGAVPCSLPGLLANSSYFIAITGVSGTGFNVIYTRLDTGQVFSQFVSNATATLGNGTITIGNIGDASRYFNGSIAAAMYANNFMSLANTH